MKLKITSILLSALMLIITSCGSPASPVSPGLEVSTIIETITNRINAPGANTEEHDSTTPKSNPTVTSEEVTTAPNDGKKRVSFLAAGDNIIHSNVYTDAKNRAKNGEKYNFIDMYADIADFIKTTDLSFVNQETPLGGDELGISGYPNFNGPQAAGEALVDLGFNIVNIATNHMLDKKEKGLQGSIDFWNKQPVTLVGGYVDKEDYENIRIVEENGIKIAFLSYTYGLNGMILSASSKLHIPLIDEKEIVSMVKKAEKISDTVVVVMHWGDENSFKASTSQKSLAKAISSAGADVILGMHSHTVQPMEWLTKPDGGRTLVVYSLGNLISTMYDNFNMVGGIVTFNFVKSENGEVTIESPIYNPVVTHYDKDRLNLQVYLLEDYTAELATAHGTVLYGKSKVFNLDIAKKYVTDTVDSEFLPDFIK